VFDLRYHVASLAAVFLALIIGILVGVGIASQTTVEESERRVLEERIAGLQREVERKTLEADQLRREQEAAATYINKSYDAVMNGRLRGVRVALLFVGPANEGLEEAVTQTLEAATAPGLVRMRALQLPLDLDTVNGALDSELGALAPDEIGRRLGREFVSGGETPFWDALDEVIAEDREGGILQEADAAVVAHTARIDHPPTARLVNGIYAGLAGSGVPAIGIERTDEPTSRIAVYRAARLSTVDSVDTTLGRVALAELLRGGTEGNFGVKLTAADGAVPPLEPLPLAPLPGG
jgi:Copper transport outer membrane protein, MctB